MDREEAERTLRDLIHLDQFEDHLDRLEQALDILARGLPDDLPEEVIRRLVADEIKRLTTERAEIEERLGSARARGSQPTPYDLGSFGHCFQLLARWKSLRDDIDDGTPPVKAMRKARRLAMEAIVSTNPNLGTPYAQALAKVSQQAASAFMRATDPGGVDHG